MTHASLGRLLGPVATFSIFLTTRRPSPSTLCVNSSQTCHMHESDMEEEEEEDIEEWF